MASGYSYQPQSYQAPGQYQSQQFRAPQQFHSSPQPQSHSQQPQPQPTQQQPQDPLANRVIVLYVIPGEPASTQAMQMVTEFQEVLVLDARAINPRPAWLTGVPTAVLVSNKTVHVGPEAIKLLTNYVMNMRAMNGAQSEVVVPTANPNFAFPVADKSVHHMACAVEKKTAAVPVGTSTKTVMSVGQVNFAQYDDSRYNSNQKGVSETDLNSYMALREQKRQPSVQWKPSLLENGDMVNL